MQPEPSSAKMPRASASLLDRPVFSFWPKLSYYQLLVGLILVLTIITRFYDLGARTMSHDEVNHVVPAHNFNSYVYDPVTHGPFQFHALAFSYFLFGESDFSARVPAAVFGVAVVAFTLFAWKRYLGRVGSLIGGVLFSISPYILFYSRYTRNEIFIVFWGLVMLWLFLRYLEDGQHKWLYWLTFITAMHYTDKATAYIFTAEAMLFLLVLTVREVLSWDWKDQHKKNLVVTLFPFAAICLATMILLYMVKISLTPPGINIPAGQPRPDPVHIWATSIPVLLAGGAFVLLGLVMLFLILKDLGIQRLRRSRSFDLLVLQSLLVLPLLTALPVVALGLYKHDNPLASQTIIASLVTFAILSSLAFVLGLLWNKKVWLRSAAMFWVIFILFYSTFFMHGEGFFKGIVGALAYWMSQQNVVRGTQPLYYYAFLQVPMYEYLPALGLLLAIGIGLRQRIFSTDPHRVFISAAKREPEPSGLDTTELTDSMDPEQTESEHGVTVQQDLAEQPSDESSGSQTPDWLARWISPAPETQGSSLGLPILALCVYWSLMSLLAFTIAGERMPWLTTHITMPMILTTAYILGYLITQNNWQALRQKNPGLVIAAGFIFTIAFINLIASLTGNTPPLQGKELPQLQATSQFLMAAFGSLVSAFVLWRLLRGWKGIQVLKLATCIIFALLGVQTARTAWRAAYINYDNAKEFLVYAHSTRDMKDALEQIETISKRLYGDLSVKFAYDDNARYPFWWYARDYPNARLFASDITKDLRDYPIIMVGTANFDKIRPVVQDQYYEYTYHRMWWPTEVYRNQTLSTVWKAFSDPVMRSALWSIWYDRDYTKYAAATGRTDLTLATWSPSDMAKLFIRKDVVAKIWEYGVPIQAAEPKPDPYAAGTISLTPERIINLAGDMPFNSPRGIAQGPDGSLYVADSRNHRIVHLDGTGKFLNAWGSYGDAASAGGFFNEPWGLAVDDQGLVYVADTWNHRIQVFDKDGAFLRMWNSFDSGLISLDGFWGPRDIAVDPNGILYVTDTGKQRVVLFDSQGRYLNQFGGRGMELGKLDEPVGITIAKDGTIYIADTWNNRVQAFEQLSDGSFRSKLSWEVQAWTSESLDNKPFINLDDHQNVYITDPDFGRIIRFDKDGNFLQLWGGFDNDYAMGVISGIALGQDGLIWVSDASSNLLLGFSPPAPVQPNPAEAPLEQLGPINQPLILPTLNP